MRQVMIRSIVTATVIGGLSLAGVGTAAASPADLHRPTGIIDGSLNNADVASGSNVLGALVNSMSTTHPTTTPTVGPQAKTTIPSMTEEANNR
jgi:hypothetical protein